MPKLVSTAGQPSPCAHSEPGEPFLYPLHSCLCTALNLAEICIPDIKINLSSMASNHIKEEGTFPLLPIETNGSCPTRQTLHRAGQWQSGRALLLLWKRAEDLEHFPLCLGRFNRKNSRKVLSKSCHCHCVRKKGF